MDCAPFKKPSRKAGLFSYRSVIPPSPHETLLRKFPRGPRRPVGGHAGRRIACGELFCFTKKLIARSLCCSSFPHETLLTQISAGAPAALRAAMRGGASLAAVFLQKSPRAHSAAPRFPTKLCLRKVSWGPPPPGGAAKRKRRTACGGFLLCVPPAS